MGDRATFGTDPSATDATAFDKGKGKATEDPSALEMSMDEEDSDESENEEMGEDDDDDGDNLEPIDASNIIQGGRRTRGKTIDYQEAAEKLQADAMEDDEDDDDEDFQPTTDDANRMHQ